VQRTMLQIVTELDGFDARGNVKVLMATNRCGSHVQRALRSSENAAVHRRPDTLDPALMRPGRLDRKIEFGLPTLEVR
jgi:26S proteasome regulatory subunit T1